MIPEVSGVTASIIALTALQRGRWRVRPCNAPQAAIEGVQRRRSVQVAATPQHVETGEESVEAAWRRQALFQEQGETQAEVDGQRTGSG